MRTFLLLLLVVMETDVPLVFLYFHFKITKDTLILVDHI